MRHPTINKRCQRKRYQKMNGNMSAKCAVSQHQLKEEVLQLNQNQDKPKPAHYGVRLQPRPCWTVQDVSHKSQAQFTYFYFQSIWPLFTNWHVFCWRPKTSDRIHKHLFADVINGVAPGWIHFLKPDCLVHLLYIVYGWCRLTVQRLCMTIDTNNQPVYWQRSQLPTYLHYWAASLCCTEALRGSQ